MPEPATISESLLIACLGGKIYPSCTFSLYQMPALIIRAAACTSRRNRGFLGDGLGMSLVWIAFLFDGTVVGGEFDIFNRWDACAVT